MAASLVRELRIDLVYGLTAVGCLVLALLPALGLSWGLGRRAKWDVPTILLAAFAFGVALVSALALLAHYVGLSLGFVLVATLVASAGLWLAGWFLGRGGPAPAPAWQGTALALGVGVIAVLERPWMSFTADTFYHLAAVRSLLQFDRPLVTDPFLGTGSTTLDPTSGVWHTVLALWSRGTGVDVMTLWPGALGVSAFFIALGFWVLARLVSRTDTGASIGTVAFMVFGWYLDFRQFPQPNRVSIALAFAAIAAIVMLAKKPSWPAVALAVSASFATFSTHLAAAELVVLVLAFTVFWLAVAAIVRRVRTGAWEAGALLSVGGVALACALTALPVLLPKAGIVTGSNVVDFNAGRYGANVVSIGPLSAIRPGAMIGGGVALFWLAAVIAVLAAVAAFTEDDPQALMAFALTALPGIVLLDPIVATVMLKAGYYLTARVAALLRFTPYVGVAWAVSRPRTWRWRAQAMALGVATVVAAAVAAPPSLAPVFYRNTRIVRLGEEFPVPETRRVDQRDVWGRDVLAQVAAAVDRNYPIVASDLETSYYLVGLEPVATVFVKQSHMPLIVSQADSDARAADMAALMDPAASEAARSGIVRRRGISYVLVSPRTPRRAEVLASLRAQPGLFTPVVDSKTLVLFQVSPNIHSGPY